MSVARLDFASFGIAARMGIAVGGQLTADSGRRDLLRLGDGVFAEAAKIGLECLRPVSEAVASSSCGGGEGGGPSPGQVQKLVFVLQLIEKMTELFGGGLGGGYSDQVDLLQELVQARHHAANSIAGADEALRQKLTIHVPGRTEALVDQLSGDALFAKELLSRAADGGGGSGCFGLFLLSCTVLSRLPRLPKPAKDAHWFSADGGGGDLLDLVFASCRRCGDHFSRDPFLLPAVDTIDGRRVAGPVGAYEYALTLVQSFVSHADQGGNAIGLFV